MAITYNLEVEGDLLVVEAHGADDDLADVQRYGKAILDACIERGCTHVLTDETDLEYRLNTLDTFKSAKQLGGNGPGVESSGHRVQSSPHPGCEFLGDGGYEPRHDCASLQVGRGSTELD